MPAHTPIFDHCVFVPLCGSWRSAKVAAHPALPPSAWGETRLAALGIVLGLVAFIAMTGPHAVHHLLEQQHTDCLVFFLTQSTPLATCAVCLLPYALLSRDQPVAGRSLYTTQDPRRIAHPRAPPP